MIGVYALSAFSAMVVHGIEYGIDDKVIVSYNYDGIDGTVEGRKTKNTIQYNAKGEAYFIKHGRRHYLNNFMRMEA